MSQWFVYTVFLGGLLLSTACSRPVSHQRTPTPAPGYRSYTGDWELIRIHCDDSLVQYSGMTEHLSLDQEYQQGTFIASKPGCQVKVNFSITQQNNALTLRSRNIRCLPGFCSLKPTFWIFGQRIREGFSCPDDLPSGITLEAEFFDDRENLAIYVPLSNALWNQCELVYSRKY